MQITINNVDIERNAKYSKAVIEYTTPEGKSEKKNVMSFTNKELYATLGGAKQGEVYDVQLGKNDKGYWEFTSATKATSTAGTKPTAASASPKSTYETPEERAIRQLYIIRQSNINAAISLLSVGSKGLKINEVLEVAKTLENYVFGKTETSVYLMEEDLPQID
jgi:hypothetical protein